MRFWRSECFHFPREVCPRSRYVIMHPKAILPHQNAKNHTKSKVSSGKNNSLHFYSNKSNCVAIDGNFFSPQLLQLLRQFYLASSGSVYGLKIVLFYPKHPKSIFCGLICQKTQLIKSSNCWQLGKFQFFGLVLNVTLPVKKAFCSFQNIQKRSFLAWFLQKHS